MNDGTVLTVRAVTEADLPALTALEAKCFNDPWSCASLQMLTHSGGTGLICLADGQPVAYCGALTVLDEADILRIATLPELRRRGVASKLLNALVDRLGTAGVSRITLEVRESNLPARALYISSGFTEIGLRKDYYNRPRESAVIMEKRL